MAFGDGVIDYLANGIKVIVALGFIAIVSVGSFSGALAGSNLIEETSGWWMGLVGGFMGSAVFAMLIFGPFAIMIRMVDLLTQISGQIDTATKASSSSDLE